MGNVRELFMEIQSTMANLLSNRFAYAQARLLADVNTQEGIYIAAWVLDQKRSIAKNATNITLKLIVMGFDNKGDLKYMKDPTVLMMTLGLSYVCTRKHARHRCYIRILWLFISSWLLLSQYSRRALLL